MDDIQEALLSDAEELANIQKITCLATYPNEQYGITKEDMLARVESVVPTEKWREVIEKPATKTFVAKVNGVAVGFCFAKKDDCQGRIGSIYILPEFHHRGLGTKLMEKAMEYLGREKPILLEVVVYNENAINFYKKLGFKETGNEIGEEQIVRLPSGIVLPEIEMVLPNI